MERSLLLSDDRLGANVDMPLPRCLCSSRLKNRLLSYLGMLGLSCLLSGSRFFYYLEDIQITSTCAVAVGSVSLQPGT